MASALVSCAGGGIGDSLMASLVARALRSRYERVDALTLPGHAVTLQRTTDVDHVLVDEGGRQSDLAALLTERAYDAAIVTWATARSAKVVQLAGIPIRVGQARRLYSSRFTHRVLVRSELGDVTTHWSQILLDYARALGCESRDGAPRFVPTPEDRAQAAQILADLSVGGAPFVILHATNAIASERGIWPTHGWAALARALREKFGFTVILSGSSADGPLTEAIAAQSGAISIAGQVGIGAFGALAERAALFVGITTGSMHIAAAVGTPTVGIFPFQTDTPERWGPLGLRTAVVRASYQCPAGERKETCPDYACIANLNVPRIVAAAQSLLDHAEARA